MYISFGTEDFLLESHSSSYPYIYLLSPLKSSFKLYGLRIVQIKNSQMKRVAPTTDNQIPLQIALTNDFLRYHQTCTVAPAKVERNNEKQQGKDINDLTDILLKSQEALHMEMVNDFDRGHETFMEKLEDDMDVTHTISSILEYHNYMVARFEEYKDRFNQVEEHFKNAAANGEDLSEKLWLDEVCDVLSGDDVNETSDASDTEIEPIKKKRRCGDDTCEDSTCE